MSCTPPSTRGCNRLWMGGEHRCTMRWMTRREPVRFAVNDVASIGCCPHHDHWRSHPTTAQATPPASAPAAANPAPAAPAPAAAPAAAAGSLVLLVLPSKLRSRSPRDTIPFKSGNEGFQRTP